MDAYSTGREKLILAILFLASFVIGLGMLMPAGLVNELSEAFRVSIPRTATLIAYGALTMCVGAPLFAFLTNKLQRHGLFAVSMLLFGAGHLVSMFVTDFDHLLLLRVLTTVPAAIVVLQATSAVSLFVGPGRQASAVAVVAVGSTAAFAFGFPFITLIAGRMGWPAAYAVIGVGAVLVAAAFWLVMPRKLIPPRLSFESWKKVFTTRAVLLVLCVTILSYIGQFILWPFVAADLRQNFAAGPEVIALLFALLGISGVVGTFVLTRIVARLGPHVLASAFALIVSLGIFIWFAGHDWFGALVVSLAIWGFGFPPLVASQQARLIGNAPALASASIALHATFLYIGQSLGTFAGAAILSHYPITILGLSGALVAGSAFLLSVYCHRRWRI